MTRRKIAYWVIPPECDAEFVAHMEDVLDTYERPYDAEQPVICMELEPLRMMPPLITYRLNSSTTYRVRPMARVSALRTGSFEGCETVMLARGRRPFTQGATIAA